MAAPVGVLGMATSPLGRWLGWRWLIHPGRRLYRRLSGSARAAHEGRAEQIVEEALEGQREEEREIEAVVPRAPRNHNTPQGANVSDGGFSETTSSGFLFDEAAADMEAQARSYEPVGMMAVLATCESLPGALQSVANTFQILAERADGEFPLEKEVGEALNEVYVHLSLAVVAANEVGTTFRAVHEQDIRRHEDPRNGDETGWDTTNN